MKVFVVGGAGYVGAHACLALHEAGHDVTVFDDLSTGYRQAVQWGELIEGSILDLAAISNALAAVRPDAVMHFGARSLVGESVAHPYPYYQANVAGTLNLLEAMRAQAIDKLVFSSTAAVFGEPSSTPITEDHPQQPTNPYGRSKLMIEWILRDAAHSYGLRSIALRYFNAAGADPQGRIGEAHEPETHLIPRLLRRARGEAMEMQIFGTEHPTPDGTCVRDYVHVLDLADAHLRALDLLGRESGHQVFNLGNGQGFSVREVVEAVEALTGQSLGAVDAPPRAGDPAILVASHQLAARKLGWKPSRSSLQVILEDAWNWHQAQRYSA
tara:strand:- start:47857 stop:48837 length:981 start_codon:yes stop_codon:yes gene_type:complete